ncbi:MAG TPA: 6,7-dimethyl-8-ribityllumazine synthase [Myxococcales bacterium]|nr:6,7-dimethyl-8-ribityllumazine synthase [Myxococcales bacterium]
MSTSAPPFDPALSADGMRFALCATRWNVEIVEQLLSGARAALEKRGAREVQVYRCTGAFELAPLAARVARAGQVDGIVALACLIRGGTDHYALLASEVTRALGTLAMEAATSPRALAVTFGVLACETLEQAQDRADPRRLDKGGEAALSCLSQVHVLRAVGG